MRTYSKPFMLLAFIVAAGLAIGQQPFPGGGPGGKGKGGQPADQMSLFQNPQVRAELKIADEQLAKLPAASIKALAEVFTPQQIQRLRGIYLQQKGNTAYLEPDVQKELKITPDQAKAIQAAITDLAKAQVELFETGGFDADKMQELQKAATSKIQGVLTQEQKTAWTSLVGQPFQMAGGFGAGKGGAGGKGGFGGGMKDAVVKGKDPGMITEASLAASFSAMLPNMAGREAQQDWQEICFRVGAPGNSELRETACKLMAANLDASKPQATRLWLLRQLLQIGRAEAVKGIAPLLDEKDELVREAAVRALTHNPAPEATGKLVAKLSTSSGKAKIGLINGLGRRNDKTAVPALAKELGNADAQVALAAARALGKITAPESIQAIVSVRGSAKGALRLELSDAYVLQAETLLKDEKADEAMAIYKALNAPNEPRATKMAAFHGMLEAAGNDAGGLIVAAIGGTDMDAREIVVAHLAQMRPAALKAVTPAIGQKLLDMSQDPGNAGQRMLAFATLVRVVALPDERPPQDKLALLRSGMKLAQKDEERRLLVEGLRYAPHLETLRFAATQLEDKAMAQAACKAVLELAASPALRAANQEEFAKALGRVALLSNIKVQSDLAKYYLQSK